LLNLERQLEASLEDADSEVELRDSLKEEMHEVRSSFDAMTARHVPVWLAPDLGDQALDANRRLLIAGPSANGITLDRTFLDRVERLVRRGAEVHLGMPKDWAAGGEDQIRLNRRLASMASEHRNITVVFSEQMTNTLAWDNYWVASDFPWLAHGGMPGLRTEPAILVNDKEVVDGVFARAASEFTVFGRGR
jgi:hypothetical protein